MACLIIQLLWPWHAWLSGCCLVAVCCWGGQATPQQVQEVMTITMDQLCDVHR